MRHQIENNMPWIRKLEDILEQVEHNANLVDMMPINLKAFKTKVEENWHQKWRYMADNKPKLRTCMKWKEYLIPELHTTNKLLKYHRSLIINPSFTCLSCTIKVTCNIIHIYICKITFFHSTLFTYIYMFIQIYPCNITDIFNVTMYNQSF